MGRSLVLNATYEPLSVVSERRAVVLVLSDKAHVLHETGAVLHSEKLSLPVPSVVRLHSFVRVPFQHRASISRRGVFVRDDGVCQYCGARAESIDHVIPRSRGGRHEWENVVAACRRCNTGKRDRYLHETSMQLRRTPDAPRHSSWVTVAVGHVPELWEPYLGDAAISA
jgi:5-methylcytosine-specific restriction endonuclease McrA